MEVAGFLAVDVEVDLGKVDRGFDAAEQKATNFDRKMASKFDNAGRSAKRFGDEVKGAAARAAAANDNIHGSAMRMATSFDTARKSVLGFVAAFAAGMISSAGAAALQRLTDAATRINNALKVAGLSGNEMTKVYDRLFDSAQRNAAPLETLVQLYSRASLIQKELRVSQEDLLKFTDRVSLALRVNGTSAQESSGALLQLSQLLGSGTVRAEEFNSVLEGAMPILQAVAAGLKEAGGSVAKLRQLVIDGKVSSEAFFRAFIAGSDTLEERIDGAAMTFSQAETVIVNALTNAIGKLDKTTGASRQLADAMLQVAGAIEDMGSAADKIVNGPIGDLYRLLDGIIDRMVQLGADFGAATGLDKIGGNPYIGPHRIQQRIDEAFAGGSYTTPKTGRLGSTNEKVDGVSIKDFPAIASAATKAADDAAKAYDRLIDTAQRRLDQMQTELALVGQAGASAEEYRLRQDLINRAVQDGIDLDSKSKDGIRTKRQEIDDIASSYGELAEAIEEARVKSDLVFERAQLGRTDVDQRVASQLLDLYGDNYGQYMDGALAGQIRFNEELKKTGEFAEDAFGIIIDGLTASGDLADNLIKAFAQIGKAHAPMDRKTLIRFLKGHSQ